MSYKIFIHVQIINKSKHSTGLHIPHTHTLTHANYDNVSLSFTRFAKKKIGTLHMPHCASWQFVSIYFLIFYTIFTIVFQLSKYFCNTLWSFFYNIFFTQIYNLKNYIYINGKFLYFSTNCGCICSLLLFFFTEKVKFILRNNWAE